MHLWQSFASAGVGHVDAIGVPSNFWIRPNFVDCQPNRYGAVLRGVVRGPRRCVHDASSGSRDDLAGSDVKLLVVKKSSLHPQPPNRGS